MRLGALANVRQGIVMAGSGAGARPGDWELRLVESADVVDDQIHFENLREIEIRRDSRAEAHLLRPYDILVTARSHTVKVALVPPDVSRTVAGATLLVVRPSHLLRGLPQILWYYLSSSTGRARVAARLTATTLPTLSVRALRDVPIPAQLWDDDLYRFARLIEAAEESRAAALEAVRFRHDVVRDAIFAEVMAYQEGW